MGWSVVIDTILDYTIQRTVERLTCFFEICPTISGLRQSNPTRNLVIPTF